jgi:polyketide biosynthesis enoyl-CoA hydratase PksH
VVGPLLEIKKNGYVFEIKISHLDSRNALSPSLVSDLNNVISSIDADPDVRFVVLKGMPDIFCSGFQISGFLAAAQSLDSDSLAGQFFDLLLAITKSPKLFICEVSGEVIGGGIGLVCAADYVIASGSARFVCPEAKYAIIPAVIFPFMQRRLGAHLATRMSLTAEELSAQTAEQWGLIDEVVGDLNIGTNRLLRSLMRVHPAGISRLKSYRNELNLFDQNVRQLALRNFKEMIESSEAHERLSSLKNISQRSD